MSFTTRLLSAAGIALLFFSAASAQEKVEFRKLGKIETTAGELIEDKIGGVKIKAPNGKDVISIPTLDVIKITYVIPVTIREDYNKLVTAEEKGEKLADVAKDFTALVPKVPAKEADRIRPHIAFQATTALVLQAEADPSQIGVAVATLGEFVKAYPENWAVVPAMRAEARLTASQGNVDGAAKILDELAKKLPKEAKAELDLAAIDYLFGAGKFDAANSRITTLKATLPPADPNRVKLSFFETGGELAKGAKIEDVVKKIKDAIDKTTDVGAKAAGYNALGDSYAAKGFMRDAMWSYLWVDAVYNADPLETLKADERLVRFFESPATNKDDAKAGIYRDKLKRMR